MGYITIKQKTIVLPTSAVVEVSGLAVQGFPNGANQWGFKLTIDGQLFYSQGFVAQVSVPLGGMKECDAGPRVIKLEWSAHPSVKLASGYLAIKVFGNTTGI